MLWISLNKIIHGGMNGRDGETKMFQTSEDSVFHNRK